MRVAAVIEREKEYPTGLRLDGAINVALAHADIIHVHKNGFALAILEEPIEFHEMANPEGLVPVHIVFVMAAASPKAIMGFIQKLSEQIFMKKEVVQKIYQSKDEKVIKDILENILFSSE